MKIETVGQWVSGFKEIFPKFEQHKFDPGLIKKINRGQIYLWHALNIYDDLLDHQTESTRLLEANNYFRRFLEIHYRLNLSLDFYHFFNQLLDSLEKYNYWETRREKIKIKNQFITIPSKLPIDFDYLGLADKSLVLTWGPLALLSSLGYSMKNSKTKISLQFFKLILTAKQLADDACDWWDDLNEGRLTVTTIKLLEEAKKEKLSLNLKHRPELIFLLFAEKVAPAISQQLSLLLHQARQELAKISHESPKKLIKYLIEPLEKAVKKSEEFRSLLAG